LGDLGGETLEAELVWTCVHTVAWEGGQEKEVLLYRSDLLANRSGVLANRSDLLAHRSDLLANRSDLLANRSDLLVNRSDLLVYRSDLLVYRSDLLVYRSDLNFTYKPLFDRKGDRGGAFIIAGFFAGQLGMLLLSLERYLLDQEIYDDSLKKKVRSFG
jgi:hypothetical protein